MCYFFAIKGNESTIVGQPKKEYDSTIVGWRTYETDQKNGIDASSFLVA